MDVMACAPCSEATRSLPTAVVRRLVGFTTLLLLTGTLLCRPGETVPGLLGLPLYGVLLVTCFLANLPEICKRLTAVSLVRQPIALCVTGMLPAVILSQAIHGSRSGAWNAGLEFSKLLAFYLLLVAVLNSPGRIRVYLCFVSLCTVALTCMALLHHYGAVQIPGFHTYERWRIDSATGRVFLLRRLVGAGVFGNPNGLCLLLAAVLPLTLCQVGDSVSGWRRWLWFVPLGLFTHAIALTQSRGGFMALLAGTAAFFLARLGWRRGTLLAAAIVPLFFLLFGGRQTKLDLTLGTGQSRIQLWDQGFGLLAESPLFGIGYGEYVSRAGLVAHNSFIHCYTELGLVGGTLFVGAFFFALWMLWRLGSRREEIQDRELRRMRPYLFATISAYGIGLLTASRAYVEPTYLMLAVVTAYLDLTVADAPPSTMRSIGPLVLQLVAVSASFLATAYTFTQVFASP